MTKMAARAAIFYFALMLNTSYFMSIPSIASIKSIAYVAHNCLSGFITRCVHEIVTPWSLIPLLAFFNNAPIWIAYVKRCWARLPCIDWNKVAVVRIEWVFASLAMIMAGRLYCWTINVLIATKCKIVLLNHWCCLWAIFYVHYETLIVSRSVFPRHDDYF